MTEESPVQPRGRDPIPRDDLKALVEEWRNRADGNTDVEYEREVEWRIAAGELEALLQE